MKKSKFLFLFALLLVPLMLFTACDELSYYRIAVNSNDSTLGGISPSGASNFKGGAQVKLKATPNPSTASTNPFVCWVKDNKEIISLDSETAITVSADTEGEYTALFEKTDRQNLMYFALREIEFEFDSEAYSSFDYEIAYKTSTNSQEVEFMSGNSTSSTANFVFDVKTPVISIFDSDITPINYDLVIKLTLNAKNSASGEFENFYPSGLTVKNTDFSGDENGLFVTTQSTTIEGHNFRLKFEKVCKDSFAEHE